jgi:regulator of protease activity HflC (stomatin/prohibitin superfamily)
MFLLLLGALAVSGIKVLKEFERAVVFRLGRLVGHRGPGITFVLPVIERMQRVDLRTVTMDIPSQDVITKDNVSVKVNAVLYFRVVQPNLAIVEVVDYLFATSQLAQTTLRSVCGQRELDELLSRPPTSRPRRTSSSPRRRRARRVATAPTTPTTRS